MKIGFACGEFDLFHLGHVLMLKDCKANCDKLIVAINKAENLSKDKNPPIYSIDDRVQIIAACRYVDEVLVYNSEDELEKLLTSSAIDIRFLGDDYKTKPITGADLGIQIYYINRSHGYSTSAVLKRIIDRYCK